MTKEGSWVEWDSRTKHFVTMSPQRQDAIKLVMRARLKEDPTSKHHYTYYLTESQFIGNMYVRSVKPKHLFEAIKNWVSNKYALWRCWND